MAFNPNAKTFDAANALLLAEASEAAYKTDSEARDLMMQRGLPSVLDSANGCRSCSAANFSCCARKSVSVTKR